MYKPESLLENLKEHLEEAQTKRQETKVEVDLAKYKKEGADYLRKINEDYEKKEEFVIRPYLKDANSYVQEEMDKSDLYKFVQIFCPVLYKNYVQIQSP